MKHASKFIGMMMLSYLFSAMGLDPSVWAQEMKKVKPMMGFDRPPEIVKMMQEPNKVLSNGSIQYLTIFNDLLYVQAAQRPDQIDRAFILAAFGEIKRSYEMAERFQKEHVKTMNGAMQEKVRMMMERMNKNLSGIKGEIDLLEKEVKTGNTLDGIVLRTGKIREFLNDLAMMRSGMPGRPMMPGPGQNPMPGGAMMPGPGQAAMPGENK
jgi:hypothetical protein